MIENGVISYSNVLSPFLWWEPENSTLNTLFIGLLTTFLSLQAISLVFDLLFARKSGEVILSDIHSFLLVSSLSPRSIWNAVLNQGCSNQRCGRREFPEDAMNNPDETGIRHRVLAKLFILLISGPVINLITVAIAQESKTTLTIRESEFEGLGWGLNADLSVAESHEFTEACRRYNVSTAFQDDALVEFSSCNSRFLLQSQEGFARKASIAVAVVEQSEVAVFATMFGCEAVAVATGQLLTEERLFLVKHAVTKETASILVDRGIEMALESCEEEVGQDAEDAGFNELEDVELMGSRTIMCGGGGEGVSEAEALEKVKAISGRLREYLTFVNAEKLELVVKDEDTSEVSGVQASAVEEMELLTRRKRNVSVVIMGVVSIVVVALRVVMTWFVHNEVAVAIELAVKKGLGIGICESLVRDGTGEMLYGSEYEESCCGMEDKLERLEYDQT